MLGAVLTRSGPPLPETPHFPGASQPCGSAGITDALPLAWGSLSPHAPQPGQCRLVPRCSGPFPQPTLEDQADWGRRRPLSPTAPPTQLRAMFLQPPHEAGPPTTPMYRKGHRGTEWPGSQPVSEVPVPAVRRPAESSGVGFGFLWVSPTKMTATMNGQQIQGTLALSQGCDLTSLRAPPPPPQSSPPGFLRFLGPSVPPEDRRRGLGPRWGAGQGAGWKGTVTRPHTPVLMCTVLLCTFN